MRQRICALIFVVIGLFGSMTFAQQNSTVQDFRLAAYAIPKALHDKGYRKLGDINLVDFTKKMESVKVGTVKDLVVPVQGGDVRSSAQWQRVPGQQPKILINQKMWTPTPESYKPLISLHENLGALGFNDKDYNLSSAMWLLAHPETDEVLTDKEKSTIIDYLNGAAENGGVIGVSGGGDMGGAGLKKETLEVQLKDMAQLKSKKDRKQKLDAMMFVIRDLGLEMMWKWQK
jgi:hypothetical protein